MKYFLTQIVVRNVSDFAKTHFYRKLAPEVAMVGMLQGKYLKSLMGVGAM